MNRSSIDFEIYEAGSLIYLADANFGGHPIDQFHEFFGGRPGLKELTEKGAVMAGSLYQDDGYSIRVVFGELTQQENAEWTSRARSKMNIGSGKLLISGVCDQDLESNIAEWTTAEDGGAYDLGTFIEVPPGSYDVSIFGFPPGDLAGGWMAIEDRSMFKACFNKESAFPYEKPLDYFKRTRPNETPLDWHVEGWTDDTYLTFLIQILPNAGIPAEMQFEPDGCIDWEYRKPERCPLGIKLDGSD